MDIYNNNELEEMVNRAIKKTLMDTMARVHKLLLEHINTDVYRINKTEKGHPRINKFYLTKTGIPSYEFREKAWDIEQFKDDLGAYAISLAYDAMRLSPPSHSHPDLHGSYYKHLDLRERLANDLNTSGEYGKKEREPYWDNFLDELRQKLGKWLYMDFKKNGIIIDELKNYIF